MEYMESSEASWILVMMQFSFSQSRFSFWLNQIVSVLFEFSLVYSQRSGTMALAWHTFCAIHRNFILFCPLTNQLNHTHTQVLQPTKKKEECFPFRMWIRQRDETRSGNLMAIMFIKQSASALYFFFRSARFCNNDEKKSYVIFLRWPIVLCEGGAAVVIFFHFIYYAPFGEKSFDRVSFLQNNWMTKAMWQTDKRTTHNWLQTKRNNCVLFF